MLLVRDLTLKPCHFETSILSGQPANTKAGTDVWVPAFLLVMGMNAVSFAPLGLIPSLQSFFPRLARWAAFLRRSAASVTYILRLLAFESRSRESRVD